MASLRARVSRAYRKAVRQVRTTPISCSLPEKELVARLDAQCAAVERLLATANDAAATLKREVDTVLEVLRRNAPGGEYSCPPLAALARDLTFADGRLRKDAGVVRDQANEQREALRSLQKSFGYRSRMKEERYHYERKLEGLIGKERSGVVKSEKALEKLNAQIERNQGKLEHFASSLLDAEEGSRLAVQRWQTSGQQTIIALIQAAVQSLQRFCSSVTPPMRTAVADLANPFAPEDNGNPFSPTPRFEEDGNPFSPSPINRLKQATSDAVDWPQPADNFVPAVSPRPVSPRHFSPRFVSPAPLPPRPPHAGRLQPPELGRPIAESTASTAGFEPRATADSSAGTDVWPGPAPDLARVGSIRRIDTGQPENPFEEVGVVRAGGAS
jgi:hypothetical protein